MDPKQAVRASVLERRTARSIAEVRSAGTAFARAVLEIWESMHMPAGQVAAYLSAGGEPATGALVYALRERHTEVLLPIVLTGGVLEWALYERPGATAPNRFAIDEPTGPRLGPEAVATADLVIVPGLAVDRQGYRLGRGGGYYDHALARVGPHVLRVILLYDDEVLDTVPHEPHDQRVDVALTPSRTLRLGRHPSRGS